MFSTNDLTRMQAVQQAHMPDTCHRMAHSYTTDEYGAKTSNWTENSTDIPCGIDQGNQHSDNERVEPDKTVVEYDAIARLPIAQAEIWDIKDKLKVTKRFGTAITPILYGVAAQIEVGPSGIQILLRRIDI